MDSLWLWKRYFWPKPQCDWRIPDVQSTFLGLQLAHTEVWLYELFTVKGDKLSVMLEIVDLSLVKQTQVAFQAIWFSSFPEREGGSCPAFLLFLTCAEGSGAVYVPCGTPWKWKKAQRRVARVMWNSGITQNMIDSSCFSELSLPQHQESRGWALF